MTDPLVVVPSYGRAGKVTTVDVFPPGVIVVPEKQRETYEAVQRLPEGWNIVAVPDEADGNIAKKRNAVLDLFPGRDLVMVDDDYEYVGSWERGIDRRLEAEEIGWLLGEGFRMAREVGTPLWGINVQVDRRFYREYTPLSLTNIVLGPFLAISGELPRHIRFDPDLWLKEDYDFSLRILHRYHRILRLNRYHYRVDHLNEAGGVVTHRNMGEEVRQLHALQRRWGSDVVKVQIDRSVNPVIKVPLKGV